MIAQCTARSLPRQAAPVTPAPISAVKAGLLRGIRPFYLVLCIFKHP